MGRYKLSAEADRDFEKIFDYGIDEHGLKAAIEYQNKLKQQFNRIAKNPLQYPTVDHIREGYRRSVCGVHSIYYRIGSESVEIMRILRSQNIDTAFK